MSRRKNLWVSLCAVICSSLLVYGVYLLQIRQVELQQTVMVVAPKSFIRAGVVIGDSDLQYIPMLRGSFQNEMVTDINEIAGKETAVSIGSNEPILRWKINQYQLLPKQNQYTFQIPRDYVRSISNGIRAGDWVGIYVSNENGESYKLFKNDIKVASVKSSANVEIDTPDVSNLQSKLEGDTEKMYTSRFEANGVIDQINLNLTEDEWLTIDKLCNMQKAKLVLAFSPASILFEPSSERGDSN